jgi:catechol 2,3-dioxygenase-like lactoylglutathione lyase family enzyme
VARVPAPSVRKVEPGLALQPMVRVTDMAAAIAFYEALGGELIHGDRGCDWVLMQVGTAQIGLVLEVEGGGGQVELNFSAAMPLERLEELLRSREVTIVEVSRDGRWGTRLHLRTPDGLPVRIHHVEPDLLV